MITPKECIDHKGNRYSSLSSMCKAYGVSSSLFCKRRKAGRSLEECLSKEYYFKKDGKRCKDHLGREYNTIKEMCEAWGIQQNTYAHRIKAGYSLMQSLTGDGIRAVYQDHLGNTYKSELAMCKEYNINIDTYRYRRKAGKSTEESLSGATYNRQYKIQDHLGKEFRSISEMCRYWGIPRGRYMHRRRAGLSLEMCLSKD